MNGERWRFSCYAPCSIIWFRDVATCDPSDLLVAGKCFDCLTEKELDIAIAQLLREWLGSSPTPEELLASGKCFDCLETKDLEIAKAQLLCNING